MVNDLGNAASVCLLEFRVFTLEEAAEITGIALDYIKNACGHQIVKHTKAGRRRGMTLGQMKAMLDQHEVTATRASGLDDLALAREMSLRSGARYPSRRLTAIA